MKRTLIVIMLLLGVLTALHIGYRLTIGSRAHAQNPSLYLDPKTGEERLVDTTIVGGNQIGFPFENTTNNFSSSFAEVLKEREMVRIGKLEESFTFGIPFSQSFGTLTPTKPSTKGNTITYPTVYGGTDLRYTVTPERLLEELVVPTKEEAGSIDQFTQTLNLGKLTARKNDDGSITILKDNTGVVFTIPKPLLYELDNKKASHEGVVYELTSEVGGTTLTKRVTAEGKKWLTDKRRHYPVVIDAAVTVATSTSGSAIGTSFQSKVIFNPGTSNYWSFYYNGSAIAYSSSTDGSSWTSQGTLSYNTFHFALTQRDSSSTVFLATQCGSDLDICVRKGTISGTTITWTNEVTALDGTNATTDAYTRPNIALSRDGYIWVAARKQTAAGTFISAVRRSTNIEDPATWQTASTVGSSETYLLDHILIPTTYQNMYLVANGGGGDRSIMGYTYNGSTWTSAVTGGEGGAASWSIVNGTTPGGTEALPNALVVSGTDLYAGGAFTTAGGVTVNYVAKWNGTSWSALGTGMNGTVRALTVSGTDIYAAGDFTNAGGSPGTIGKWSSSVSISASASTAQEITTVSDFSDVTHLLYVDGNADVKYKKFSSGSWGSAVTLLTGTASNPSIAINKANGDLYAFWVEAGAIKYKRGVAPYGSANWDTNPTTFYSTGTNATITAGSRWDGVFLQWTNGTGSPYGVLFDKLSAGTSVCYPPPGGALYVESNCAVTGTIGGADDGDLLISSGKAFTVNAGQTITWGPGKAITIGSGGSISMNSTGQIKQTNQWMTDADGDGYPASTTVTAQTNTPGGTYVRRKTLQTYTATDANDSDASVH